MGESVLDHLRNNSFMLFYAIALLLSLKKYHLYFTSRLKFLPILIGYTFLSELLGFFIMQFDSIQIVSLQEYSYANNLIYNIYDIVFFIYFFHVYWVTFRTKKHKNLVTAGALIYLIASVLNPFCQDFTIFPQMYAYVVGSLLLMVFIFLYFLEIKRNKQNNNELLVWISIGLIVFYSFFPFILFTGMLDSDLYRSLHLRQWHHLLISGQYICFILGFLRIERPIAKN